MYELKIRDCSISEESKIIQYKDQTWDLETVLVIKYPVDFFLLWTEPQPRGENLNLQAGRSCKFKSNCSVLETPCIEEHEQ